MMLDDVVRDATGFDFVGPTDDQGNAESAFPVGVLFASERCHPAIGPAVSMRTVIGGIHHERVVRNAEFIEVVEHLANVLIVVDHRVVIRRLPAAGLSQAFLLRMREQMHVREVEPYKERLVVFMLTSYEVLR